MTLRSSLRTYYRCILTILILPVICVRSFAAAEPAACLSSDPAQWPQPAKPYFMFVVDTSKSMGSTVAAGTNSCGYQNNRLGHARCAIKNLVSAYAGVANFGLATYAWKETNCLNATCGTCDQINGCFAECTRSLAPGDDVACGPIVTDVSLDPALNVTNHTVNGGQNLSGTQKIHAGGLVVTPLLQDHYWTTPPDPSNTASILSLVDNSCGNSELGAASNTPLGGTLFNLHQYFSGIYVDPFTGQSLPTPIGPSTFNGQPAERACRSINIILITDGDESCDTYNSSVYPHGEGLAVFQASRLFNTGVTVSGQTFRIKTSVIGFVGATMAALDNIAAAGGTSASYTTQDEAQLSQAISNIIVSALKPEKCDNVDNNCNGCTDEGFSHYADVQAGSGLCCVWSTSAQRATCLANYQATITPANPRGDVTKLPCTTVAQSQDPATWLCYNPGEQCDNIDNNGNGTVDETVNRCGNPLHCPTTEVCNGQDDNCNGLVDEGNVCPTGVTAFPEVCDGCDNNYNGIADDLSFTAIPCGLTGPGEPANCQGTQTCKPQQNVAPGTCATNGGLTTCNNSPQTEVCDGLDNNCDGVIDNNVAATVCTPSGTDPNLNYGPNSQCKKGATMCANGTTVCGGFVGPSAEICDGIDNDCDGVVDNNVPGVGQACGKSTGACQQGLSACVNGTLVCQGGVQPQPEVCDGIDNNCDGVVDGSNLCTAGKVCRSGQCVTL